MHRLSPHARTALGRIMPLLLIVAGAALFRAWLIAIGGVSFDSDEAIVGLMARHMTQGAPLPTFFYGQAYMGSLDALLVAGGFTLLGESVTTIRVVQLLLYLLALVSAYGLALTVTGRRAIALVTLLLLAIPTPLGALYTTLTLGGYNELILFGNLMLLLGWQITVEERRAAWRWALLGLITGVGWWTNGAIVIPALVVVLLGLRTGAWRDVRGVLLAGGLFIAGSAPWWVHNLRHNWAALDFLVGGYGGGGEVETLSPVESLLGLLLLGLPALYGLRLPWEAGLTFSSWVLLAGIVYVALLADLIAAGIAQRRGREPAATSEPDALRRARGFVWLTFGAFALVFALSSFADATGRYLMPLWVPAALGVALGLERLARRSRTASALMLLALLLAQGALVIQAATSGTGLQPQLVERLQIPRDPNYDADVLAFLRLHDVHYGYASYWTAYRLTFKAHEDVILVPALPHEDKTHIGSGDRYRPYADAVRAADRVVWITQNYPALDAWIADRFAAQGIRYRTHAIGPYRIYYDLSTHVTPTAIGLHDGVRFEELLAGD